MPRLCTVLLVLVGLASTAHAQNLVDANDMQRIAAITADMGYGGDLVEEGGVTSVALTIAGVQSQLDRLTCDDDAECGVMLLSAGFTLNDPATPALMQEWNAGRLFGQAYLDADGNPFIVMSVNLRHGVTEDNFRDTLQWWEASLITFVEHINFTGDSETAEAAGDEGEGRRRRFGFGLGRRN